MDKKIIIVLFFLVFNQARAIEADSLEGAEPLSCDFSRSSAISDSSQTKVFTQALSEMDSKGLSTLSLLMPHYEVHLELVKNGDTLEMKLMKPTRLRLSPDAPKIQRDVSLWILQQLRASLKARHYGFENFTLTVAGIILKEKLIAEISQSCPEVFATEDDKPNRFLAYFAGLGNARSKPAPVARVIQISVP